MTELAALFLSGCGDTAAIELRAKGFVAVLYSNWLKDFYVIPLFNLTDNTHTMGWFNNAYGASHLGV